MDCTLAEIFEYTSASEGDILKCGVVGQHGDHCVSTTGVGDLARILCALIDERLCLGSGAVVDGDLVSSIEQAAGHGRSHIAEANESDFHDSLLAELDHEGEWPAPI